MTKGQLESEVLKQCLDYLQMRGIFAFRNNTGALKIGKRLVRFGMPGSSDILGILPNGQFLAVECKREKGGILSDKQVEFLNRIKVNGGVAVVVHSVNDLEKIITSYFTDTKM
jgi:hypothetical protein